MGGSTSIRQSEERLRDVVNRPDVQGRLIGDKQKWGQLCSAMDVIGDTECAIAAYLGTSSIQDLGQLYLLAYGLLQVLFVQQDAVRHVAEVVGVGYKFPSEILAIRGIRNSAIGHPTKCGSKSTKSFGITQVSLSHEGFTLYSVDLDKPDEPRPVRFKELIDQQAAALTSAIEQIIGHLLRP